MQVSGFSVVRNAIRYDYPFIESLQSLLPLVDELVLAVGDCDDGTVEALAAIDSKKLKVIHTTWGPGVAKRRTDYFAANEHCPGRMPRRLVLLSASR